MARLSRAAARSFSVGVLIWLAGTFDRLLYVIPPDQPTVAANKLVTRTIIIVVLAGSVAGLAADWRRLRAFSAAWPVLLCVVLAGASALWSVMPSATVRAAVALTGTTAFGVFFALRFDLDDQLNLLAIALGFVVASSLFVVLAFPQYGIMVGQHAGAWSGVFRHKNILGRAMALAALVYFCAGLGSSARRAVSLLGCALALALAFASRSRTAEIVALASLTVAGGLRVLQRLAGSRRTAIGLVMVGFVALAVLGAALYADRLLALLGKDNTLDYRTVIWSELLVPMRRHLWFGYGYGAFWRGVAAELGGVIARIAVTGKHAHNGFLDLVLELGLVGLVGFLVPLVFYLRRALRQALANGSPRRLWPVAYLVFFVLSNLTESALVRENKIYWALYAAATFSLTPCAGLLTPGAGRGAVARREESPPSA